MSKIQIKYSLIPGIHTCHSRFDISDPEAFLQSLCGKFACVEVQMRFESLIEQHIRVSKCIHSCCWTVIQTSNDSSTIADPEESRKIGAWVNYAGFSQLIRSLREPWKSLTSFRMMPNSILSRERTVTDSMEVFVCYG